MHIIEILRCHLKNFRPQSWKNELGTIITFDYNIEENTYQIEIEVIEIELNSIKLIVAYTGKDNNRFFTYCYEEKDNNELGCLLNDFANLGVNFWSFCSDVNIEKIINGNKYDICVRKSSCNT